MGKDKFKVLGWAAALLLPNLLLLLWLFRHTSPSGYLATVYSPDPAWPLAARLPPLAVLISLAYAWVSRRAVTAGLALGAFLFCAACLLFIGGGLMLNLLAAAVGVVVLAAATGIGLRILALPWLDLTRSRRASALEQLVLAAALGLGALALAVFLFGSLGLLSVWFWWPAILLLCAINFAPLRTLAEAFPPP